MIRDEDLKSSVDYSDGQKRAAHRVLVELVNIFAAINNATKVGGIMKLDKEAVEFNDGEFELMLVEFPKNPVEFIRLAVKIFTQQFTGKITLEKIKSARITDCTDIDWSLDGEKEKGRAVVDFKVIHDAVNFIY